MEINESEMARYVGNYSAEDPQHTENIANVIIKESKLLLKVTDPEEVPLEKVGRDQFTYTWDARTNLYQVHPGKDGRINIYTAVSEPTQR
jgi:hypothetical protein